MTRTITALFDTNADAEAGKQRLLDASIDAGHIHISDKTSEGFDDTSYSTHQNLGAWGKIKNALLPDTDRHTYEEGIRRGGFLLTADVGESEVDAAVAALEASHGVDIDERASDWRSSGWDYPAAGVATGAVSATSTTGGEEVIPVVEESLVVGKREVDRGGVRVRSYITETPVQEQIRLREEHVNVERRAVDLPLSAATGDAFRERTIEMTETSEEAVVGKTARVVEEVVVSKSVGERTEEVHDTVRRTDVEVENVAGADRVAGGNDATLGEKAKAAFDSVTGRDRV